MMVSRKFGFLRAQFVRSRRVRRGFLDPVMLLDVLLLAGLFSLAHAEFLVQPGIRIDLPEAAFEGGASYQDMVVTLVDENIVFFNDERTTLAGLESLFKRAAVGQPELRILLEADGRVQHETLVRIYNMARNANVRHFTVATGLLDGGSKAP